MNNTIRNISLKNILNSKLSEKEQKYKSAVEFLMKISDNLYEFKSDRYKHSVFYGKSKDEIFFEYYKRVKRIHISYYDIWDILINKYQINHADMRDLILNHITKKLKLNVDGVYHMNNIDVPASIYYKEAFGILF